MYIYNAAKTLVYSSVYNWIKMYLAEILQKPHPRIKSWNMKLKTIKTKQQQQQQQNKNK